MLGVDEGQQDKRLTETYCTYQFSSEPVDRAIDVPKSTGITINSNIGMSVGANDFSVTGAVSGDISGTAILPIGETTRSVTFTPDAPLSRGEKITVSFLIPLDPCGTPIEEPYVFQFVVDTENYVPSFSDSGQRIDTGCANHVRFDLFDYDPTEPTGVYVSNDCSTRPATGPSSLLENNGVGHFQTSETRFLNPVNNQVSAVGDINSDGLHDLVVKYEPCTGGGEWGAFNGNTYWQSPSEEYSVNVTVATRNESTHYYYSTPYRGYYGCTLDGYISDESGDQIAYRPEGFGWFWVEDTGYPITATHIPYTHADVACRVSRDHFESICKTGAQLTLADLNGDQNFELLTGWKTPLEVMGNVPITDWYRSQNRVEVSQYSYGNRFPLTSVELEDLATFEQAPNNVGDLNLDSYQKAAVSYIDLGLGDLDNDGDDDLVILENRVIAVSPGATIVGETNELLVYFDELNRITDTSGSVVHPDSYELPAETISGNAAVSDWTPKFIDLGDIDGDNYLDLLISAFGEILILINQGNGRFLDYSMVSERGGGKSDIRSIPTLGSGSLYRDWHRSTEFLDRASLVDLDSDGDLDIHRNGRVWLNDGFGEYPETFVEIHSDRSFGAYAHIFADFDEDGDIDVMMSRDGIIEIWFNDLYEPDPLLPSFGVTADKYDKSGKKNGGSGFDRETSVIPELDPIGDESENKLQPGTLTESEINPHDDENKNQLKSGTITEYDRDTSTDLTWDIKRIESEGDAGKMITMDYQNSGLLHMMYQEGQSKEVYYKKYNTVSGSHSAAEDIYNRDEGDEVPGDIKAECGLFDLDNGRPVCGSFYLGADLFRFGYIGEQTPVGNFAPAPPWSVEHIEEASGNSGEFSTVLIDSVGLAHIIYFNTSDNNLMYTVLSDDAQSNDWTNWEVPVVIDSEAQVNVGQWAKAVINDNDDIHVIYRSGTDSITHLFSPSSDNPTRTWSKATLVDSSYTKSDLSLALDSDGNPHAVYYQHGYHDLIHASAEVHCCHKPSRWIWSVAPIDVNGVVGRGASLAIGSDDTLHVSYHDETNGSLKYASSTFSSQFNAWSNWDTSTIDKPSNGNIVGKYTDIIVTDSEAVYIAYYDESTGDLKLASGE